jgi:hypothetical protein
MGGAGIQFAEKKWGQGREKPTPEWTCPLARTGAQAKPNHAFSGEDWPGSLHMDARPHCGKPGVLAAGGRAHAQHVWSTRNGGAKVSKRFCSLGAIFAESTPLSQQFFKKIFLILHCYGQLNHSSACHFHSCVFCIFFLSL